MVFYCICYIYICLDIPFMTSRHVTGQVLLRNEGQSVFWQFVKEHLSATEIRRFNSLEDVNTEAGRGMCIRNRIISHLSFKSNQNKWKSSCCFVVHAWLRSALNEQSLEKYLHSFLGHKQLLRYEKNKYKCTRECHS